jgi:UDP-4-amino-4,6-dideoxy-N-acetyl-beta-L-altrosamine transaminase
VPVIPYGRQSIDDDDVAAVTSVLRSDFLTQGPQVERFEQRLAEVCGAEHVVAVNSATSALHIAYLALGLGPGKRLWTSPNTFVATANAALLCGASVDFVDIDPRTYNLDPQALARKLEEAQSRGEPGPDVVTIVDFAGQPCAIGAIRDLANRFGFRIVEDASHAVGATWRDEPIGCGSHADVTVFSFHPVKIVTTGEGGAALTRDAGLAEAMRLLRSHGVTRDPEVLKEPSHGLWYYEQHELGLNYCLTDLQAALGITQLSRLQLFLARRREIAIRYDAGLSDLPVTRPWQDPEGVSAYHLYPVVLDVARFQGGRRSVFEALRARGIGVQVHYIPVHTQPYYRHLGFQRGDFPAAEQYYAGTISLPIFPALTCVEQTRVIEILADVCSELCS